MGEEVRFDMSEIRFNINRANYESHTSTPRLDTIKSMKAAVRNNMAIARLEHPEDLPLSMQAAIDTHTQFQPTRDPGEARSLMFAECDRTHYQFPEQLDERTEDTIKAVKMVEAQGVKDDSDGCANVYDRTHISQTTKQFPVIEIGRASCRERV